MPPSPHFFARDGMAITLLVDIRRTVIELFRQLFRDTRGIASRTVISALNFLSRPPERPCPSRAPQTTGRSSAATEAPVRRNGIPEENHRHEIDRPRPPPVTLVSRPVHPHADPGADRSPPARPRRLAGVRRRQRQPGQRPAGPGRRRRPRAGAGRDRPLRPALGRELAEHHRLALPRGRRRRCSGPRRRQRGVLHRWRTGLRAAVRHRPEPPRRQGAREPGGDRDQLARHERLQRPDLRPVGRGSPRRG